MRQHDLYVTAYTRPPRGRSVLFHWTVLAVVFLVAAGVSYVLTPAGHSSAVSRMLNSGNLFQQFQYIMGLSPLERMLAIWFKNLIVALVLLGLGGFLGGVLSYLIIGANGILAGVVIKLSLAAGSSPAHVAASLLPHGVIELPAIFLAGAVAMYAAAHRRHFFQQIGVGLARVAALLLIAAAVETFITPWIMGHFH